MASADDETRDLTRRDIYPHWVRDVLRYADTDRQGHVNNAVFATFLESGRASFLYNPEKPLAAEGTAFVIARLTLDFRREIHWPNDVDIGTAVLRLGRSSITLGQGLFVRGDCAATAETVIVLMNEETRGAHPLPDETRAALQKLTLQESPDQHPPSQ